MTQAEFEQMVASGPRPSALWRGAFTEYNIDNKTTLGMGCMSCYVKVQHHMAKKYSLDNNGAITKAKERPKRMPGYRPKPKRFI